MKQAILIYIWYAKKIFKGKPAGGSEWQGYLLFKDLINIFDIGFFVEGIKHKHTIHNGINLLETNRNPFTFFFNLLKIIPNYNLFVNLALNRGSLIFFLTAKLFNKKTIYFISQEADLGLRFTYQPFHYRILLLATYYFVDVFVAQTQYQADVLRKKYRKKQFYILPNPVIIKNETEYKNSDYVLWVGRNNKIKGIDILIDVVKALPDIKFKIIGINNDEFGFESPNVDVIGRVDLRDIDRYYNNAGLLISTSYSEGFPNVFLQSFANKTPIVSYKVNPDNFLNKSGGGICSQSNVTSFIETIRSIHSNKKKLESLAINGFEYVKKYYEVNIVREKLIGILNKELSR